VLIERWRQHSNAQRPHSALGYTQRVFAAGPLSQDFVTLGRKLSGHAIPRGEDATTRTWHIDEPIAFAMRPAPLARR